jgi:hypothetical protein
MKNSLELRFMINQFFRTITLAVFLICFTNFTFAEAFDDNEAPSPCFQSAEKKLKLIKEAEEMEFNVKRVELSGNGRIRYYVFAERFAFMEGDIFTFANLLKSIEGVSKVRGVYPITLSNVKIQLEKPNNQINVLFCVAEKKKKKRI